MKKTLTIIFCGLALVACAAPKKLISPIISGGKDGKLTYDVDERGNRVPDFSSAGYAGGDRPIPDAPVRMVVSPMVGDETTRIQKAIDYVAGLPMDTNGIRGAVLLLKGRHEVAGSLKISGSGVVLRGQGEGKEGTMLVATGIDRRTLIRVAGADDLASKTDDGWVVTDEYVPVGAVSFHVKDASALKPGMAIRVVRPGTKEWIDFLGMTDFGGGINDWRLVWHAGNYDIAWQREIKKIEGNTVTVDAPVTTALEAKFGGGHVETYSWPGRVENIGIENLALDSEFNAKNAKDENHAWFAVTMDDCRDAWVRNVTFRHFAGSAVALDESCQKVTVADCVSLAPISEDAGWRRNTFFTTGQQTLFLRCRAEAGRHDFATGTGAAGPNVFVDCEADLPTADSGAIGSWASGTLFDNVRIDGHRLDLMNRGGDDGGAGWSAANCVLWNCIAAKVACDSPPGAQNWAFGSWGEFEGHGIWRDSNTSAKLDYLYAVQLGERVGAARANAFMEEGDITTEPGDAKPVDDLAVKPARNDSPPALISVTNGWLVCDGKLLTGGIQEVNWWKGNMLPTDANNYGVNLSRYAPGRIGAGFTDDLDAVAAGMMANGLTALDHHYGLWYDRRREDHERVRRMTGDVWAPFYEMPFARSGNGKAWDGLSRYDLTKFNPWYWSRLQQFADICDQRGLVLFNEHYFQHNILEDGAHWVDGPWRSSNNINNTGFKEPAFEIEKRTVMADQFYDVTNAVRRKLNAGYIRQNLDNFTNEANVIQFTSAEFTGPLAFEQFWIDTIGAWEAETGRHPLIALAAPKNVQDAILADAKRAAVVDVIAFRYWWLTDKGLYAPNGGENQSPRQFFRQWKGGQPTDENLAAMTAEYRAKYPSKVVMAAGEQGLGLERASWAYLCAGGSMPRLPKGTDEKLLAAIPGMQPWAAASQGGRRALREAGKQMLVCGGGPMLDLSGETGTYRINLVNARTGTVTRGETVAAGATVKLPEAMVVWLVKE